MGLFGRGIRSLRWHVYPTATHGESAIDFLVRILCAFAQPGDILATYLRRPVPQFSFQAGMLQIAEGRYAKRPRPGGTTDAEIVARAIAMLQWLEGSGPEQADPFKVLGVSCSATDQQIQHQYRVLSKRVHPDRHPSANQEYWCGRQNELNEAYRKISDPRQREQWRAALERRKRLLHQLWRVERMDFR